MIFLPIVALILLPAGLFLKTCRSRVIAWFLFVAFLILTAAWGIMSVVTYPKPFTGIDIMALRGIAAAFFIFAAWSLSVAVKAKSDR
jgi:hypothetical protein